ncbi:MAG: hypothetical protein JXA46_02860 [Dehalococcoidales bacterium]|nr:hypothetical protein [Dehalococcoidales bacterium]
MLSWNEALKEHCKTLEQKIIELQPSVDEYNKVKTELDFLQKSQEFTVQKPENRKKRTFQNWCDELGLKVGGDSAHRVLKRECPDVHVTIPHYCTIDKREYP